MTNQAAIRLKFEALCPVLNERARRLWAAAEAQALGRGGLSQVAAATGLSRATIRAGLRQLREPAGVPSEPIAGRIRRPGAGRKPLIRHDLSLVRDLEALVEPTTRGDPQSPSPFTGEVTYLSREVGAYGYARRETS